MIKGLSLSCFCFFNFLIHQVLTYVYSLPPSLSFFSLFFFFFKDVCLVLASHNGNGWKRWNWWSLSSMSFTLWQRKDCGDGSKLWKVVRVLVRFCAHFVLYNLISCWVTSQHSLLNRLVAERNLERKQKLQKSKPKPSEGRKHLIDVRVIQRNLVYIIGLPLNLADEDVSCFIPLLIPFNATVQLIRSWCFFYFLFHFLYPKKKKVPFYFSNMYHLNYTFFFGFTSFFSTGSILASMGRFWRCPFLVQQMGLFNILQTTVAVCKLSILLSQIVTC